ncbi:hypothetical protein ccbrp13_71530 [Ktedonobacteria bacterium brp13]|nr:hypothetical protein ccbrp13_71530 [Ktedonobacteria bacterium brp13]
MNKSKRHSIKKEKKGKLIGSIASVIVLTYIAMDSPFASKAINDGNMFFMFWPLMLIVPIVAVLIIWGMLKKKN